MIRRSSKALKYSNYTEFDIINVWVSDQKRIDMVKRLMLADKNFKVTSLKVNPIYKPIFDKIWAEQSKEIKKLEDSWMWSPKYTKTEFKHMFIQPFIFQFIIVTLIIMYGVKYRLLSNYIKHDRKLEFAEKLSLDFDDIDKYPKSALELLVEKKKYDSYIERKDKKITEIEDNFHKYAEQRVLDIAEIRRKRGLGAYD